jgi:hypothetical protein
MGYEIRDPGYTSRIRNTGFKSYLGIARANQVGRLGSFDPEIAETAQLDCRREPLLKNRNIMVTVLSIIHPENTQTCISVLISL